MGNGESTVVVLTCMERNHAAAYLNEFKKRQNAGWIDKKTHVMIAEDPKAHVGSGGATLNALLVVTEFLSGLKGNTVVDADCLRTAHVLILHLGGDYVCDPCGKAFTTFAATQTNAANKSLSSNVDFLLDAFDRLSKDAPYGVWVCSTEMFLSLTDDPVPIDWQKMTGGIVTFCGTAGLDYASQHGVVKMDPATGLVQDIIYRGTSATLQQCELGPDKYALVTGLLHFSPAVAERLLSLLVLPPLEACTYFGVDNGAEPFELRLFLDLLRTVANKDYPSPSESSILAQACVKLRAALTDPVAHSVHCVLLDGARYVYLQPSFRAHAASLLDVVQQRPNQHLSAHRQWSSYAHVHFFGERISQAVFINALVGPDVSVGPRSVVAHCQLTAKWRIGSECFVSGVRGDASSPLPLELHNGLVLRETELAIGSVAAARTWLLCGLDDNVELTPSSAASTEEPVGTFCNQPWAAFLARTGISPTDLWDTGVPRTVANAKLFPVMQVDGEPIGADHVLWMQPGARLTPAQMAFCVQRWRSAWRMSMRTVVRHSNVGAELAWREELGFRVAQQHTRLALTRPAAATASSLIPEDGQPSQCILPFLNASAAAGRQDAFALLDDIAANAASPAITARALACIADLLSAWADGKGGLRSGPGRNASFAPAMELLEADNIHAGVAALAAERAHWFDSPEHLVRAARHYESAAQIFIRKAVMTAHQFVHTVPGGQPLPGKQWVVVETAARIDLAGGWSDTPPITYEHGGKCTNAAIMINGRRPIGARVRRIASPQLVLVVDTSQSPIVVDTVDQLRNYTQPQAPGALLKAAFCCARIVSIDDPRSLQEQLTQDHACGFELHTWSNLPTGSGLGTSSILAGAVMAALWRASGQGFTKNDVSHAVLHLEQMLTTGGGWQDQVGGIEGGVKISRSEGALPLRVDVELLPLSPEQLLAFSKHLVLIYTGKTRLARNLLQNVLRNWYARMPEIVANADALTANAEECAKACRVMDLAGVGRALDTYWAQKKLMAPGCEPAFVAHVMNLLRPLSHGMALAGAGGGGFMFVISKDVDARGAMEAVLAEERGKNPLMVPEEIQFYDVAIDPEGLVISLQD